MVQNTDELLACIRCKPRVFRYLFFRAGDRLRPLELDLWRVLAETIKKWERDSPPARWPGELEAWRERFLAELTDAAYGTTLRQVMTGSFLEVELGLYQAFRSVIGKR